MTAQAGDTLISTASQKSKLRRQIRAERATISLHEQKRAAAAASAKALRLPALRCARHVAVYLEFGSELSTAPLLAALHAGGKQLYVPKLGRDARMRFVRLHAGGVLRKNRYGIPEPVGPASSLPARRLDVIVLPLTAFDAAGNRLGSGGGYYDRALARARPFRKPRLLGYAYALQQVAALPSEPWDVRLDAVATERALKKF